MGLFHQPARRWSAIPEAVATFSESAPGREARERDGEGAADGDTDRLSIERVGATGREQDGVGAERHRVAEDGAYVVGVRDVLEHEEQPPPGRVEERREWRLGAPLPDRETTTVEVVADDAADEVVLDQQDADAGVGRLQEVAQTFERGRRQQDRARPEAPAREQPTDHLPALGDEE